ncbi:hypothetical protein MPER_04791 [Moniliophthora perniciosa FA553]|nr:hypothetical protein MPER_04791 [Moniliophthora perniciosa FA553]
MERLVIRAYGPPRVYQDKDARPALDNPVQFLEWCGKPLPGRIAQHEPTTFAQILFASVKAMKMVEIRIGDGQEGLKARGAQKSFQELEEEGAIISKVAKSNLLSYFRSITHLDLDSVEFASPEDIWDVCHAFGPNLQTLVIQRLFLLGNNYVLGPSTSRIACPTVFPVLRTLEMYLRGPAMTYFLNCCVSLPSLETLECDLSYYDLDKTSYKVMMRLFRELLSSASGLRTIIFTSDSTFHSNRAEAVGKLIGLSKHAPALVHLVIEPDLNGAAARASKIYYP